MKLTPGFFVLFQLWASLASKGGPVLHCLLDAVWILHSSGNHLRFKHWSLQAFKTGMRSLFSRRVTSRGSLVPLRFKACKSVLFTKGSLELKIKNTWLMKLTHYIKVDMFALGD